MDRAQRRAGREGGLPWVKVWDSWGFQGEGRMPNALARATACLRPLTPSLP
jgi:hypothetical protein